MAVKHRGSLTISAKRFGAFQVILKRPSFYVWAGNSEEVLPQFGRFQEIRIGDERVMRGRSLPWFVVAIREANIVVRNATSLGKYLFVKTICKTYNQVQKYNRRSKISEKITESMYQFTILSKKAFSDFFCKAYSRTNLVDLVQQFYNRKPAINRGLSAVMVFCTFKMYNV